MVHMQLTSPRCYSKDGARIPTPLVAFPSMPENTNTTGGVMNVLYRLLFELDHPRADSTGLDTHEGGAKDFAPLLVADEAIASQLTSMVRQLLLGVLDTGLLPGDDESVFKKMVR